MFDISWGELVLIGVVALIVIGPKELPTVLRTAGQWMTKMRRMAAEFQGQFQEAMREAEFADLKQQVESIGDPTQALNDLNPLETAQKELDSAFAPKPEPTPSGEPQSPAADTDATAPTAAAETNVSPSGEPAPAQTDSTVPTEPAPAQSASAAPTEPAPPPAEGGRAA
jgi:sec-independent protein translocase protein TatB